VNVGTLSTENNYEACHAALSDNYDSIIVVPAAGIGWEEYESGKVRMPKPGVDCVWDGQQWICPEPEAPGGE
jgi:hypothetical protein